MSNDVFRVFIQDKYLPQLQDDEPGILLMKIYRRVYQEPEKEAQPSLQSTAASAEDQDDHMTGFSTEFFDHYLESAWMNHLASVEEPLAPKIYMDFQNGRLEQFLEGKVLTGVTMKHPRIIRAIARKMALLHRQSEALLSVTQDIYAKIRGTAMSKPDKPFDYPRHYWKVIKKSYVRAMKFLRDRSSVPISRRWNSIRSALLNDQFFQAVNDVEAITLKLDEQRWQLLNDKKNVMAFIHLDLQPSNIMMLGSEGRADLESCQELGFIDYEYGNFGPPLLEIANHLGEWPFTYGGINNTLSYDPSLLPKPRQMLDFLRIYEMFRDDGVVEPKDFDLDKKTKIVQFYMLIGDLKWSFWAIEKFIDRYEEYRKALYPPLAHSRSHTDLLSISQRRSCKGEGKMTGSMVIPASSSTESGADASPNPGDLEFMDKFGFYLDLCQYKLDHFFNNLEYMNFCRA